MSDNLIDQFEAQVNSPRFSPELIDVNARVHELKTWPEFWDAIRAKQKTFEVRRNDRGFQVGDMLELLRWCPHCNGPVPDVDLGYVIQIKVTYVLEGGRFGIEPGFVVLGFVP